MNIIIVVFTAFGKSGHIEGFIEKSWDEIHEALHDICSTYIPTQIIKATNGEFQPLNSLTKFTTETA